jgi:hypothetical protein
LSDEEAVESLIHRIHASIEAPLELVESLLEMVQTVFQPPDVVLGGNFDRLVCR